MVHEACQIVVRELRHEVERRVGVDEYAEDQVVVFQALAGGGSFVHGGGKVGKEERGTRGKGTEKEMGSLHTRTVRWVCGEILGTMFDGVGGCEGGGLQVRDQVDGISKGLADLDVEE